VASPTLLLPRGLSYQDDPLSRLAREARTGRLNPVAQHDYGFALLTSGHEAESVEHLARAVRLAPRNFAYQTNYAAALHQVGRWNEGLDHATQAYELDPRNVKSAINVAGFYYWFGETEEAVRWYDRAIEIEPNHWQSWWMRLFMLDFLPISAERALAERKAFSETFEPELMAHWPKHTNDSDPERRLRIGFTGGDFRQHSSSYMWGPLFEHIDRDRFEVYSYAHLTHVDNYTAWFQQATNGWRDITQCHDDQMLAKQIMADEIDVLVDLGTFSEHAHLGAHLYKPAPVSLTAWGHLTGTGLRCMDGLLVDRVMLPENRAWETTERPAYVPYAMGWAKTPDVPDIEPPPERSLTFGYLGRIQKLDDPTVALWSGLLRAYPESRLLLKDVAYVQERSATRTLERFKAHGVDPSRVELRGGSDRVTHLETYRDMDVALDPLPQGGGATTLEALMMGVPSVTLRGERLVRRVSASTVTMAGHPEWVAETASEYIEIAGRIVKDRGPHLRGQFLSSHICDGKARTRAFEDAVRSLWRQWVGRQAA
jgi:predicted O-linked N-acetylglucosamine transferase (SPINDLY family)